MYSPKTGSKCGCKRGIERDNCPSCEGTGMCIDFKAIRDRKRYEDHQYNPITLDGKCVECMTNHEVNYNGN